MMRQALLDSKRLPQLASTAPLSQAQGEGDVTATLLGISDLEIVPHEPDRPQGREEGATQGILFM